MNRKEQTRIKVVDEVMGTGKTNRAIGYMNRHSYRSFIYITPTISEVKRIVSKCPNVESPYIDGVLSHRTLLKKLDSGVSIATTHKAFEFFDEEVRELIVKGGFTLILDEVSEVIETKSLKKGDFRLLTVLEKVKFCENGVAEWIEKRGDETELVDKNFVKLMKKEGTVYYTNIMKDKDVVKSVFFTWLLSRETIDCFEDIIILTYMFDCSMMAQYFRFLGYTWEKLELFDKREVKISDIKKKITILEGKINNVGYSSTAFATNWTKRLGKKEKAQLKRNVTNVIRNKYKGKVENTLVTCLKNMKIDVLGKYQKSFLSMNMKGTNDYGHKTNVIYLSNRYLNPFIETFYQDKDCPIHPDHKLQWALSEMIQWIWRSAIRNGEEINVYIPSIRMRTLFQMWLNEEPITLDGYQKRIKKLKR